MLRMTLGATVLALATAPVLSANSADAEAARFPPALPDFASLSVGDVIAVGALLPGEAACLFEQPLGVRTEALPGLSRTLRVAATSSCHALVIERSERPALPNPRADLAKGDPALMASKFVWQRVNTHGACPSCTWDRLTSEYGELYFNYDGSNAQMTDFWWTCEAPGGGPWWHWVVDACPLDSQYWGPAGVIWQRSHGSYYCDPPGTSPCSNGNGYYHTLNNDVDGHADGTSHCTGWFTGRIVYYDEAQYVCTDP